MSRPSKNIRKRGKLGLSKVFADVRSGDTVALVRNLSFSKDFPDRFQGKTGVVLGKRGMSHIVKIMDGNREKMLVVKRINLKKLSN